MYWTVMSGFKEISWSSCGSRVRKVLVNLYPHVRPATTMVLCCTAEVLDEGTTRSSCRAEGNNLRSEMDATIDRLSRLVNISCPGIHYNQFSAATSETSLQSLTVHQRWWQINGKRTEIVKV